MDDEQLDGWMNKQMDREWIDGQQTKVKEREKEERRREYFFGNGKH